MQLQAAQATDPRQELGAYISDPDGKGLFEVVDRVAGYLTIEDCKTLRREEIRPWAVVVNKWTLVREAPVCPDTLDSLV